MKLIIFVELLIILIVFFTVNLMKHWQLMILPDILVSLDSQLKTTDIWFYTIVSYLAYFYGNLCGEFLWHHLSSKLSTTSALFLSLLFMGLFSYLQGMATSLNGFFLFRFLLGLSMNLEKSGKAFIHEKFSKAHRSPAFFIDSAAYTLGTLSGPLVGLTLFHFRPNFPDTCKMVALLLVFCALLHYSMFSIVEKDGTVSAPARSAPALDPHGRRISVFDEERIPFLKRGSVVNLNWRNALIHALWDNKVSRALIIISLVNATAFHLNLVLTTLYLYDKSDVSHHRVDQLLISQGNVVGGLASLLTIAYIGRVVRDPGFYTVYMRTTICVNAACTLAMPFFKQVVVNFPRAEACLVWGFFMLKEAACYYLYSQILSYLISVSIFKLFRKPLNFVMTTMKSFLHATSFNAMLPVLYIGKKASSTAVTTQLDYILGFWLIAACQLLTLTQFKYIRVVLDRSNMID